MKLLTAVLCLSVIFNLVLFVKMFYYRKASLQDELTNLPNARALQKYLKSSLGKSQIGFVILDIDNFKYFNSINIHKGDDVLKEFSNALRNKLLLNYFLSRYRSGDEFALVFVKLSLQEVDVEMKKLLSYFQNYTFICLPEMPDYRIKFSFGSSEITDKDNINKLFEIAEYKLANAKREKVEFVKA